MEKVRIIARLDVKPPDVIKGVHFEGWRKVGVPEALAVKYYEQGADEIFYIDCVASLFRREILYEFIRNTARNIFVPFCVGGGVKSVDDVGKLIHAGADKVLINTYALANPGLIREASRVFGSQCIVLSIEAKQCGHTWLCHTDKGRINSGKDALEWAKEAEQLGAGEILLSSIDKDGRKKGFDCALTRKISESVTIPVVASGGAGALSDVEEVIKKAKADAVALASVLHYGLCTIDGIKKYLHSKGIAVSL